MPTPICAIDARTRWEDELTMRKAEGWTQAKFTEWGLRNVHKEGFDFRWVNVFSTANDHVLHAAYDVDVTVGSHHGQIASVKPAVGVQRFSGLFRHVVVTDHV